MKSKKSTQYKQAAFIGIHPSYLSRLLNGKSPFTYEVAEKLAEVLPGDIIFWKNANPGQLRLALNNAIPCADPGRQPDGATMDGLDKGKR